MTTTMTMLGMMTMSVAITMKTMIIKMAAAARLIMLTMATSMTIMIRIRQCCKNEFEAVMAKRADEENEDHNGDVDDDADGVIHARR